MMKTLVLQTKEEWDAYKLNTCEDPAEHQYPVLVWMERCGGGLAGEADVSFFKSVPKQYLFSREATTAWANGYMQGRDSDGVW